MYLHVFTAAAMFCKPLQDRRVSPAMVSKGSIYAAVQQDPMGVSRVLNGNNGGTVGPPAARHDTLPFNHRATPNSDDTSDPDGLSNTSFDTSIAVSPQTCRSVSDGSTFVVGMWIYIVPLLWADTQDTQVWITQFYLLITPYLPLPRKRSPDGATTV